MAFFAAASFRTSLEMSLLSVWTPASGPFAVVLEKSCTMVPHFPLGSGGCYPWLLPPIRLRIGLEQGAFRFDPTHPVVIQNHAPNTAVFGQGSRLWLNRLCSENTLNRR